MVGAEIFDIPIGLQLSKRTSAGRVAFQLYGEIVASAQLQPGFDHRAVEQAAERRSWGDIPNLLGNIFAICPHAHVLTYCLGVERLAGIETPPRAQSIRTLVAELERVQTHLLWFGALAYQAGLVSLFTESWQDREIVMDLLESLSGKRLDYSAGRLGGVKYDLTEKLLAAIQREIDGLVLKIRRYLQLVLYDPFLKKRTQGVGVTTRSQAEKLGLVGPTARSSGVLRDIRLDSPYAAYHRDAPKIVLDYAGDLQAHFSVRLKEALQSFHLIRRVLDGLPTGPIASEHVPVQIPAGETVSRVEAPCGELFYFIKSYGEETPGRIKIRTPTQSNMMSLPALAPGHHLADVPLLIAGVDPFFSFNDRSVVISGPEGPHADWTWDDLRGFGIAHYGGKLGLEQSPAASVPCGFSKGPPPKTLFYHLAVQVQ